MFIFGCRAFGSYNSTEASKKYTISQLSLVSVLFIGSCHNITSHGGAERVVGGVEGSLHIKESGTAELLSALLYTASLRITGAGY